MAKAASKVGAVASRKQRGGIDYQKGSWIKLDKETLRPGDFLVSDDCNPNNLEHCGEQGHGCCFTMMALPSSYFGLPANKAVVNKGIFWRLIGLVSGKWHKPRKPKLSEEEKWALAQKRVMDSYKKRGFVRTAADEEALHMFFSPGCVPTGLTQEEVFQCISFYAMKRELDISFLPGELQFSGIVTRKQFRSKMEKFICRSLREFRKELARGAVTILKVKPTT